MEEQSQEQFHELSFYTLAHGDKSFIHQHAVDALAVQTATTNTKPISLTFGLAGLYLFLEKNYSGKEVQLMHMRMAKEKKVWPSISLPSNRGNVTVADVLNAAPGKERDEMIRRWCASVWSAYKENHATIEKFVSHYL